MFNQEKHRFRTGDILLTHCLDRLNITTGSVGKKRIMTISIERGKEAHDHADEQVGLECPYCNVYSHMTLQSAPTFENLVATQPEHIGVVYQCDACTAPVFLRYPVKAIGENSVELYRNFVELERPKERFAFSYLPKPVEVLFREALSCYSHNNFNAFASMCRRAAASSFSALGENGKLQAFDEAMVAQRIADIDDDSFDTIKQIIFEAGEEDDIPLLNRAQAGVLLEVLKDMFYQCFVRRGKLTRAIKVRQFFVRERNSGLKSSA